MSRIRREIVRLITDPTKQDSIKAGIIQFTSNYAGTLFLGNI